MWFPMTDRNTRYQSWHQRWHLDYPEPGEAIQKKQDWTFRCRVLRDPSWYFSHYTEGRPSPWILTSNYTKTTGTLPPNTRNSPRYLRHPFWTPGLVTQSNPCRATAFGPAAIGTQIGGYVPPKAGCRMIRRSLLAWWMGSSEFKILLSCFIQRDHYSQAWESKPPTSWIIYTCQNSMNETINFPRFRNLPKRCLVGIVIFDCSPLGKQHLNGNAGSKISISGWDTAFLVAQLM